ncbi:MAG: DUF1330 domain-containing protein [Burkholderiaceae bacterium]
MPAYWMARARIDDPVEYKKYADRVPKIVASFGGKILARGGKFQILEGTDRFSRFVVIEFATLAQAVACHDCPAYQEASAFRKREGVGEVEIAIVEALDSAGLP